jgi:hypothetical protein
VRPNLPQLDEHVDDWIEMAVVHLCKCESIEVS